MAKNTTKNHFFGYFNTYMKIHFSICLQVSKRNWKILSLRSHIHSHILPLFKENSTPDKTFCQNINHCSFTSITKQSETKIRPLQWLRAAAWLHLLPQQIVRPNPVALIAGPHRLHMAGEHRSGAGAEIEVSRVTVLDSPPLTTRLQLDFSWLLFVIITIMYLTGGYYGFIVHVSPVIIMFDLVNVHTNG